MSIASQKRLKRDAKRVIRRAKTPEAAAEVLDEVLQETEDVIEQSGESIPGTVIGNTKRAWTYQDCLDRFEIMTFVPDENIPLTFNGVRVQALANVEMHVPKCFYNIYRQHKRIKAEAAAALPRDTGFNTIVQLGAGTLGKEEYREV